MGFMHHGLDGKLLKKRQRWLTSLLFPMSCSVTFKPGISFRGSFSCQSFTLMGTHLLQSDVSFSGTLSWQPFWSSLICCNLASSSAVVSAAKRSHWQVLISSIGRLSRASASVSPLSQPFLLFLVCLCRCRSFPPLIWVSREAGSLPLSVFTLSTQLLSFTRSFKLPKHAKAKLAGEVVRKSYYVCMRLAAIALNYSVKDIRHDVRQIIIKIIIILSWKIAIEQTSVGLAHARPNYLVCLLKHQWRIGLENIPHNACYLVFMVYYNYTCP